MPIPSNDEGLSPSRADNPPDPPMQDVQVPMEDDRIADTLEAKSIAWNVARIVRLSSGRYALLTHYRKGALDIIKVGTLEEIAPFIPTPDQCIDDTPVRLEPARSTKRGTSDLLFDLGL